MPHNAIVNSSLSPRSASNSTKRPRSVDSRRTSTPSDSGPVEIRNVESNHSNMTAVPRMPLYLQKSKSDILSTFQDLEWKQRFRLFHAMENPRTSPYRVDRSDLVVGRNRYANVQPWDASRIKLRTPLDGSDYVNASPIVLTSQKPFQADDVAAQTAQQVSYIATQGPKAGQYLHFWHLVHQETSGQTGVVVMLTSLVEEGKEKCDPYYPAELDAPIMILAGPRSGTSLGQETCPSSDDQVDGKACPQVLSSLENESYEVDPSGMAHANNASETQTGQGSDTVTLLSKEYDDEIRCEVRHFLVNINQKPKTIVHYYFAKWPDFGKPDFADRKALVELCRRTKSVAADSPRIVHCSAGVGRTGTWIALDFLLREVENGALLEETGNGSGPESATSSTSVGFRNGNANVNNRASPDSTTRHTPTTEEVLDHEEKDRIYEVVNCLREQRMMMVIRDVQFAFLYEVIKDAVLGKYSSNTSGPEVMGIMAEATTSRGAKARRISGEKNTTLQATESSSDAETDILQTDVEPPEGSDPYAL